MGADAVWICLDCKTVCARGGTPIFQVGTSGFTQDRMDHFLEQVSRLNAVIELDNYDRYISFLTDLKTWLGRHEHHHIHIGSDYTTDGMDLEDFHNETVRGEVDIRSRHEVGYQFLTETMEASIQDIEKEIVHYAENRKKVSSRKIAEGIFNRFSTKDF